MIYGIGVDLVDVTRFIGWDRAKCQRFFHPKEIKQLEEKRHIEFPLQACSAESFAARFAAKEAFGKALGTGLAGFKLKDMAVLTNESGNPSFYLFNNAERILKEKTGGKIHLSLSHEKTNAIAFVLIEV